MKKIIPIVIAVVAIFGVLYYTKFKKSNTVVPEPVTTNVNRAALCFYGESKTKNNLYDTSWLRLNITGDNVIGEFNYLPAEKDKKTGTFDGTVGAVDKISMARTANVMWNSMAEGTTVTEQLKILFGEGSAQAGFGAMVDRGDGVYLYQDESKITFGQVMTDIGCNSLGDIVVVEQYVRANYKNLITAKPVLGGTWYVTNVHVSPNTKTVTMLYEDGHIQGSKNFKYHFEGDSVVIEMPSPISITDKYIHPIKWPPVVTVVNSKFACKTSLVNGYCITNSAEGAAGSTYTTYVYTKPYGNKTAKIEFTIQSTQCLNYDEPQKGEGIQ